MSLPESFKERVVVGFDGSEASRHAVQWAAGFAAQRSYGLTLITGVQVASPTVGDGGWFDPAVDMMTEVAERELSLGKDLVQQSHPGLDIEGYVSTDSPAPLLVGVSRTAALTVVGSRGRGGLAGMLLGSVSAAVASHGVGPVAVVPKGASLPSHGPILVGASSSEDGRAAVRFAVTTAAALGAPLEIVRAWGAMRSWDVPEAEYKKVAEAIKTSSQQMLDELIVAEGVDQAGVPVTTVLEHGSAEHLIVEKGKKARLIVVGSRGLGGFSGLLMGSTSRNVLHGATVPVVVVHANTD